MQSIRKLFQKIIDDETLDNDEVLIQIYFLSIKLNRVNIYIEDDLFQLTYHLAKILFCNNQKYEYWVREITNKYLNVFPTYKFGPEKINRESLKQIIETFKESEFDQLDKFLSKANCDLLFNKNNRLQLKVFSNKFFDEYLKTFKYNKVYPYYEIDSIIQRSM